MGPIYTVLNSAKHFPHTPYIYSAIFEPIQTKPTKAKLNHPFKILEAIQAKPNQTFMILGAIKSKPNKLFRLLEAIQTNSNKPFRLLEAIQTNPSKVKPNQNK